jgi:hypothetical protein
VSAAPDLIEPVAGFRDWRLEDGRLESRHLPVVWSEPTMVARCWESGGTEFAPTVDARPHRPPGRHCSCGIYAYYWPDGDFALIDVRGVCGIVTLWGNLEVHADGMRAEFARIEALGVYSRWTRRKRDEVAAVADALDVDVVAHEELGEAVADYGRPLPASMIPPADPEPRRRRISLGRVRVPRD